MSIDRNSPLQFEISYNAEYGFIFVVATGFLHSTDNLEMIRRVLEMAKTVPSPLRLVADYTQAGGNAFEVMQFMKQMGDIIKQLDGVGCREILLIDNKILGRLASLWSTHPQYGRRKLYLFVSYEEVIAYITAHPLT